MFLTSKKVILKNSDNLINNDLKCAKIPIRYTKLKTWKDAPKFQKYGPEIKVLVLLPFKISNGLVKYLNKLVFLSYISILLLQV